MPSGLFARRALGAGLVAIALLALSQRVVAGRSHVRLRIVTSALEPVTGRITLPVPDSAPSLAREPAPYAAIWRISNTSASSGVFVFAIDGRPVCERRVQAAAMRRLDCAVDARQVRYGSPATLTVEGPASGWSLTYLELATHHGGSPAFPRVQVFPAGRPYPRPGPLWTVSAGAVLLWIAWLSPSHIARARWRRVHRACAVAATAIVATAVASPLVTPFELALAPSTWIAAVCIVAAPRLHGIGARAVQRVPQAWMSRRVAAGVATGLIVLATCATVVRASLARTHGGEYSGFLRIAAVRLDANPLLRGRPDLTGPLRLQPDTGYDAQFLYFIAFDPFVRAFADAPERYDPFIDAAPYRYGRIGFPLLTKAVSFDRGPRYPAVMVWLVVAGVVLASMGVAVIAAQSGRTPLWGLIVLLVPGFWKSLEFALPEPIAGALLIWGLLAVRHRRWVSAGVLFGLALLVRETGVLLVVMLAIAVCVRGDRRDAGRMLAIALLPLLAWRLYLGTVLQPAWGVDAFFFDPGIHGVPLKGLIELRHHLTSGEYAMGVGAVATAARWYAAILVSGALAAGLLAAARRDVVAVAASAYAGLALCLTYSRMWEHVGNVERGTYEVFLLIAVASLTARAPHWLRVCLAALWIGCGVYLLYGSIESDLLQTALFG